VPVCLLVNGRQSLTGMLPPCIWLRILFAALVYACAWLAYYSAARRLQLVELETIYFASPLIATLLAVLLLGERVSKEHWLALLIGLGGVTLACGPTGSADSGPVALALLAAALWAYTVVLIRQLALSVPTSAQMLVNNAVFLVMCGTVMPWWWQWPTRHDLLLLVGSGGMLAQYLL
ncbi:EamA family transporter, partial [Geminicoccus flavidas]|uniref:EamA family transporter n=1 Tax=Geminicoccus flavidas TaxID=2506407 RepID=UPI00135CBBEF